MRKQILIFGHNDLTHFIDIYNQYTRLFDKNNYEVTVIYLRGEPSDELRSRTLAENVIFLNVSKKSIRTLKIEAVKKVLALCREKQFEMVICHRYKPSYIMMWVAQFVKIPALIFVMHELKTMSSFNRQLLIKLLFRKNMYFAGVSNAVRDDMRRDLWCVPKEKVVTLYNVIDIDLTEPHLLAKDEARRLLNLSPQDFVFGNVARLAPNKDQKTLIQAFSILRTYHPNAKLVILGSGDLETELKAQVASLGLANDVIFTGFLANGFRYLKAFDCFVLSSVQEAFGRVLIEAMVAKLPIIATHVHGIPEVIQGVGTLVQPQDVASLAKAMQNIYTLSQEEREILEETLYQHVKDHFSIPAFHRQFWQLMSTLPNQA